MNIKSITPNPVLPVDPKAKVDSAIRTQHSTERDADGRQSTAEDESKRQLNDEEFEQALETLKANPGLKSNGLVVRVEAAGKTRFVMIESPDGLVVRRLSEGQLWLATREKDRSTGALLDKAM